MFLKKLLPFILALLCIAGCFSACNGQKTSNPSTDSSPDASLPSGGENSVIDTGCAHKNTKKISSKEPTCITEGYSDRLKCKDCGEILDTTGSIQPALGHQYKGQQCIYCDKPEPDVAVEGQFEGTQVFWRLYSDGELEFTGSGATPDFPAGQNSYFYRYNKAVTSIVVYDGITRIGDGLCRVLKEAETISIASSVTEIGDHAFEGWELEELNLSMRLKKLGKDNFTSNKLFFLELPGSLEYVGSGCFESTQLITLRVPDSITTFETVEGQFSALENLAYTGTMEQLMRLDLGKHLLVDGKCANVEVHLEYTDEADDLPYCTKRGKTFGDFTYIVYSDNTARISKYNGSEKDLVIPSKVDSYTVTGLYHNCFEENKSISKVTIPKTVKKIEREAFLDSTLSELVILSEEIEVGDSAFDGCNSLNKLTFDGVFTDVGHGAFAGTHVSNLNISEKMMAVRDSAFANSEIKISDLTQFQYIGDSAFAYTDLDCALNLQGVKEIGMGAFYKTGIESVDVTGVKHIGAYAFYLNGKLTTETVTGLDTVQSVDPTAFDFSLS